MPEYQYTPQDRVSQLTTLAATLRELIHALRSESQFASHISDYKSALIFTESLLRDGFTQERLSELSRAVPDLYSRHKDWIPPLEQLLSGEWREPEWYSRLESKLQPTLKAAQVLREIGYY